MNDLVSIVVPIYNMGSNIEKSVASLQAQEYANIEILLVDDGSKDDSYQRCMRIAERDERVTVFHTENQGSGPARNYGIDHAAGKYIYFPDADDYLEPNAVSIMVQAMENGRFDLVVFGYRSVNKDGKLIGEKRYEGSAQDAVGIRKSYADYMTSFSKWGIQGAPWNKFFDLDVIRENEIRFPPLRRHQDEGFIGRYMCYARSVHFISDILYTYYVNDLRKEWEKYPVDYIDAVIGLNDVRKETILTWNSADQKTHDLIAKEYICNVIKALELSFSPKMALSRSERKRWILDACKKAEIGGIECPNIVGRYQQFVCRQIKGGNMGMLYRVLWLKVNIEKSGFLAVLKGLIK